jgi:predicted nucleotidyltransferase component of viral defense system
MPDRGASVLGRLKSKSKETGKSLQVILQLFCQEEFLRRLSLSKYKNNLVLKGGLFIYTLTKFESRATIDIDFLLRNIPNNMEDIKGIIDEINNTSTGNDFIELESRGFEIISEHRKYKGISFQIVGKIKNSRTPFNVDIGVGDIIVPSPEFRSIPVQLPEFKPPEIATYSLESTIAEKFDAMLQRLELTSRMKDFYDIWYIANLFDFDGSRLLEAIFRTLQNRGTLYDENTFSNIIGFDKDPKMQKKWKDFIRRLKLPAIEFGEVLSVIDSFLSPVWHAMISGREFHEVWDAERNSWD